VTVVELAELIGVQADIQLVDVRNPGETVEGTLPAARAVPLAELVGSLDEFDPETPTVVYCAGGYRSLVASSVLRHAGFTDVSDLLGGYGAWAAAGLPVVTGTKQPGDII
jgi:rhodanese-related sulfurtransferase